MGAYWTREVRAFWIKKGRIWAMRAAPPRHGHFRGNIKTNSSHTVIFVATSTSQKNGHFRGNINEYVIKKSHGELMNN